MSFRDLQRSCGDISPSILNSRIKDLKEAAILERSPEGYCLTPRGQSLRAIVLPLGPWSFAWSKEVFSFIKPGMTENTLKEKGPLANTETEDREQLP